MVKFSDSRPSATVILGAGFSYCAGLPLTSQLFETDELPPCSKGKDQERMSRVQTAYRRWKVSNASRGAEQWLQELYLDRDGLTELLHGTSWFDAVQFALRRLTGLKAASRPYYYGISRFHVGAVHQAFWEKLETSFRINVVVSMNYDILVERALHSRGGDRTAPRFRAPRFRYGGFPYRQSVKKWNDISDGKTGYADVVLGNEFSIYKMHGSLNWAFEPHSQDMKIHDDVRAVFRKENAGEIAIIPPIPEKEMPERFRTVWRGAEEALLKSDIWIVCGYSRPEYDRALDELFDRCASNCVVAKVVLLDPCSTEHVERWSTSDGSRVLDIVARPGLPGCLECEWD